MSNPVYFRANTFKYNTIIDIILEDEYLGERFNCFEVDSRLIEIILNIVLDIHVYVFDIRVSIDILN